MATVQFFHVLAGDGKRFDSHQDYASVLDRLASLNPPARARDNVAGMRMTSEVWDPGPGGVLTAYRVRRQQLPGQELDGAVDDLEIDARAGLAEGTSVMFFSPNIMGVLFNREGPSFAKVCAYLTEVGGFDCTAVVLIRPDAWRQLQEMEGISQVVLRARPNEMTAMEAVDNNLASAMEQASRNFQVGDLEVVLRFRGPQKQNEGLSWGERIAEVVRRSGQHAASKARVTGKNEVTGETEDVNLLASRITVKVPDVEFQRDGARRRVTPEDARDVIAMAYDQVAGDIERAVAEA